MTGVASRRGPHAQSFAIPDGELTRVCQELVSVIMSIPEGERVGWYRSMERFTRTPAANGQHYELGKAAGAALRLMNAYWGRWPE